MRKIFSVLIVDNDQQIVALLVHFLKRTLGEDIEIIIAKDESSAVSSKKVDIALVEFSPPTRSHGKDSVRVKGVEIIKQLKSKYPEVIIIAMSSCGIYSAELIAAGADHFIADTYDQSQLAIVFSLVRV